MPILKDNRVWQRIVANDNFPLLIVVLLKVLLHLLTINRYGYFIDELYNIASARNLSSGFVEISHLGPMIYAGWISVFGHSLFSLRMLALIPGVITVVTAGWIARELGGKRFAQFMTSLTVCLGLVWLAFNSFLGCDGFDQAASAVFLLLLIRIFKTGNQKLWMAAGIAAGVAILFKQTLLFYLPALFLGLLLTKHRRSFLNGHFWAGVLCGLLVLTPQIIWEFQHHWPLLEYWSVYARQRTYHASWHEFVMMQVLIYSPAVVLVWLAGVLNFLMNKKMSDFKVFGFLYIFLLLICFLGHVKAYVTAAIYPVLFAGGYIGMEELSDKAWMKTVRWVFSVIIIAVLFLSLPHALPVFNVQNQARYFQLFSFANRHVKFDSFAQVELPEFMADRLGWEERVRAVAEVYHSLPPDQRKKTSIYAHYYGFAGAIDVLGKRYGLPDSLCGHLSYHLWGYKQQRPENLIVVQVDGESLKGICEVVEIGGYIPFIPYAMPYDNGKPIFVCKKMKLSIEELWPLVKHYD
ncbi:MAG TPA: glycosyltransferase family 39 protein [Smithella sp.]|nr:glycosyltransferase family 39 protein [Smithella sp.]